MSRALSSRWTSGSSPGAAIANRSKRSVADSVGEVRVSVERPPEVPTGIRGIWRPSGADGSDSLRGGQLSHPVGALQALANAEVELREHVRPSEPEHEEHLRAPATDALHRRERLDDLGVLERI